jgi:hypothetical protein
VNCPYCRRNLQHYFNKHIGEIALNQKSTLMSSKYKMGYRMYIVMDMDIELEYWGEYTITDLHESKHVVQVHPVRYNTKRMLYAVAESGAIPYASRILDCEHIILPNGDIIIQRKDTTHPIAYLKEIHPHLAKAYLEEYNREIENPV